MYTQKREEEGKRPLYMLHTYGQLHSITNTKFSLPTGHITFKANRKRRSLVVITLAADDLKIVTSKYIQRCHHYINSITLWYVMHIYIGHLLV